jgi:predicted HicB family RNase H-like nuclease
MEQVRVRMSEELRERLKAEAKRSVRSLNGEIVFRLRQSVEAQRQRSANPVEPGRMNATQDPST